MKADETEKDWKGRCFNEQQLPICSGSLSPVRTPQVLYFAVLHRSAVGTAEGVAADVCEWGSGKYNE